MIRILTLDDDWEMGALLKLVLASEGYRCVNTDDSFEAWALLKTLPFDLLTQDTSRPDIDGIAFYRLMRADASLDDVPVLMVTARRQPEDLDRVFDADLDGYLTKPFGPQELRTLVADVLRGRGKPVPSGPGQEAEPVSTPALIAQLSSDEAEARLWAARDLGLRQAEEAVEPLLASLEAPDAGVRWAAALALGRIETPRALQPLVAVLEDEDERVRVMVAHALGKLGDPRVGSELVERLDDESGWVQRATIPALGAVKASEAVSPLVQILREGAGGVRREAASALGRIGGSAVASLLDCLNDEAASVRRLAMSGLALTYDGPRVGEALIAALDDPDAEVRRLAVQFLGRRRSTEVVEPLIAALDDECVDVVSAAAWALGWIGDRRALPSLRRVARKDERQTRQGNLVAESARSAIQRLKAAPRTRSARGNLCRRLWSSLRRLSGLE